jgi:hypothetical protein
MIILIAGATHTGKTALAQRLLEKYGYPYLSLDHLKMGLMHSGHCRLTPNSPVDELTRCLWPTVRGIVSTAHANSQNLIIEGCYIPPYYQRDFQQDTLVDIRYVCLVMSEKYIEGHYEDIARQARVIERRVSGVPPSRRTLAEENRQNLELCKKYRLDYVLIDDEYEINWKP